MYVCVKNELSRSRLSIVRALQTDRQTHRQTDRHTDRQTDRRESKHYHAAFSSVTGGTHV